MKMRSCPALLLAGILTLLAPCAASPQLDKIPRTKSGFVTTAEGVKIHYLKTGHNVRVDRRSATPNIPSREKASPSPAILFVPGWTMPAWIWEHQISHFSKTHRVVAMDPRGQGESSKPAGGYFPAARARDIKAVIDQRKLAPVVLIGWSMGVIEIGAFVDQFGTGDLAGIVLVDGIAGYDPDPAIRSGSMGFAASFLSDREKRNAAFVRSMYRKPQAEAYLRRVEKAALQTPTHAAVALIVGNFTGDYRPALAKVDKPTLFLAAGDDKSNPWMARYRDSVAKIPGGRLVQFPDCGHALFADDPARFNSVLEEFLHSLWN